MKNRHQLILATALVSLALPPGCKNNDSDYIQTIRYVESASMDEMLNHVDSVVLVPIMLAQDEMMGSSIELLRSHDSFLTYDMVNYKTIRYSDEGRFLNFIGRFARGPGEYPDINDVQIIGDTVIVFSSPGVVLRYTLDGDWAGTTDGLDLGLQSIYVGDGILTYYGYQPAHKCRAAYLKGGEKEEFLPTQNSAIPFAGPSPVFSFNRGDVFMIDSFNDVLFKYSSKGMDPYLRFDFGKYAIGESFYADSDPYSAAEKLLNSEFGSISRYLESDEYRIVEFLINKPDGSLHTYGACKDGIWYWFGESANEGGSFFRGSVRALDGNDLYCLFQPSAMTDVVRFFSEKIVNREEIENVNPRQLNYVLAKIALD